MGVMGAEMNEGKMNEDTLNVFFALVRAGLWSNDNLDLNANLYEGVDWGKVYRLAEEQSVIGLVAAGIENLLETSGTSEQARANTNLNLKVPQEWALQFIGQTLQIEQRSKEMNDFIGRLSERLRSEGVSFVMVKGQGVAQCYEKPLWRASGDVDLLLDNDNYEKAKRVLFPMADEIEKENVATKHQALKIMGVDVELHGRMPFSLSRTADKIVDEVIDKALHEASGCVALNTNLSNNTNLAEVPVPLADEHVFLVFTHFLHHFFIEGVGLRQICDWCRLLFCYREKLDLRVLESRIRRAGLMSEWRVFYNLASRYLGMPDLDSRCMFNFVDSCHDSANHASTMALAAPRVQDSGSPQVEFQILGNVEGPFQARLDELVKKGVVKHLGTTPDVRPYIGAVECTVMPSYHEGMSNVNLESEANGRPVITTNVPGCRETVDDGRTGYLVEARDADSLAAAMERFMALPYGQKVLMGQEGRRKVEREFDREIVVKAYMETIALL